MNCFCTARLIQIKRLRRGFVFYTTPSKARLPNHQKESMSDVSHYSVRERLRDGTPVEVRALRPEDESDMLAALDQTSAQSLQRRFFAMKRHFSDKERAFFMHVDFKN